jgi:hypothetical protein
LRHCPADDPNCFETPDSASKPDDMPKPDDDASKIETVVVNAYRDKEDSDKKKIRFDTEGEQGYVPDNKGIHRAVLKPRGEVNCGSYSVAMFDLDAPAGASRAHIHPDKYGSPGRVPGPGDDSAARASSAHVTFVMTSANLFTIRIFADSTFSTTVVSGPALDASQGARLVAAMQNWENPASHGAGLTNYQRYCGK